LFINGPEQLSTRNHKEIHMYSKAAFMDAWPVLGATIVACTLLAGTVAARDQEFTVAYKVSTQGLDLSQPAGAHELYNRLKHAAEVVCTHGMRVDLEPVADENACFEQALAAAVRSANRRVLTRVYLETHTLQQAAARGIDVPAHMAAK
jgi:UrcA family protein